MTRNSLIKTSFVAPLALFALVAAAAPGVFAQAPPTKIGIVHIQSAIISTRDGQKAAQDLQAKFDPRRKSLEAKQSEIANLQQELSKGSNTMAEAKRVSLTRDIDQKTKSLNRETEDAQAEFEQEQNKIMNELGGRLMAVIDKYGKDNGYTLILDVSSQQTPVLFVATGVEVTKDIIELYDKNSPTAAVKPAASPAAASKPAAPPAATPKATPPAAAPKKP
ncbi:MAG: OmpH family outer membrane protein [Acidobacteriia bacterium]|nr:OmpH family outer membrane protein [Terriglobia bacterium]